MPLFVRQIVQNIVRKAASDPVLREKASNVSREIVEEGKQIVKEKDRAYAAGKAFRRALNNLQKER